MKAFQLDQYGGPDVVKLKEVPRPEPKSNQILIQVYASAVYPVEWKIRSGDLAMMNFQFPVTLGCDFAGRVVEDTGEFRAGDEVFGSIAPVRSGAFAEYAIPQVEEVAKKPSALSFIEAASFPVIAMTAHQALFELGNLQKGQTVLVHGGAGGVGSFAVQYAHRAGARVIATASRDDFDLVRELGADEVIDYKGERFEDKVKDADLVLDLIGGDTQKRSFIVLRKGGVLVTTVGPPPPELATQYGVKAAMVNLHADAKTLVETAGQIESGDLKVRIDRIYPFEETLDALKYAEAGKTKGKVLIKMV